MGRKKLSDIHVKAHNGPDGFQHYMKLEQLLENESFGTYLEQCEENHSCALKVCDVGAVFKSGTIKIRAPMAVTMVEFPTCDRCGEFYLGHHKKLCYKCFMSVYRTNKETRAR